MTAGARWPASGARTRGRPRSIAPLILLAAAAWPATLPAADADDTAPPPRGAPPPQLSLTQSQQEAVGIRIEQPLPLSSAPQIEAYGTVLDPAALVTDLGKLESTHVAATAAAADASRVERLYHEDTQASLKALQAAQAQASEAAAQARAAALNFNLQWGPLASLGAAARRALIEALTHGRQLLLRADVPAQHLGSDIDRAAVVEVDGVHVSARVLGPLPRTDGAAQSAGWLLQLEHPPQGLGPGARTEVRLRAASAAVGVLVPGEALVYAEQGAYVYRRQSASAGTFHYVAVPVRPLTRIGSAWLVEGLGRSDQVVVQGAGVLWSLQGIGSFSAAEEEHD